VGVRDSGESKPVLIATATTSLIGLRRHYVGEGIPRNGAASWQAPAENRRETAVKNPPGWFRYAKPKYLRAVEPATPAGFETAENSTKHHEDSRFPTEKPRAEVPTQRMAKRSGSMAAKLAVLAANAVRNWDLARALELLEQIRAACEGETPPADLRMVSSPLTRDRGT
jgi:hypothetical protein